MRIYAIEGFLGGSHKSWLQGWKNHSQHQIEIFGLPGRHWKWRMEGAAIPLAKKVADLPKPDAFVCSDMLNLALFKALIPYHDVPFYLYMHENQLSYPWSPEDPDVRLKRDVHYGFINYTSCLVADHVFFNSNYHKEQFLYDLDALLARFPDAADKESVKTIEEKSAVVPISLDVRSMIPPLVKPMNSPVCIVWNHRWEYDKNPVAFFDAMFQLQDLGIDFELLILGQSTSNYPDIFDKAKRTLDHKIIHIGTVTSRSEYIRLLQKADIALTTSKQDFFGISVVEAIAAGCIPLLPNSLAYPEHISIEKYPALFYNTDTEMLTKLVSIIQSKKTYAEMPEQMLRYDWEATPLVLDQMIHQFTKPV